MAQKTQLWQFGQGQVTSEQCIVCYSRQQVRVSLFNSLSNQKVHSIIILFYGLRENEKIVIVLVANEGRGTNCDSSRILALGHCLLSCDWQVEANQACQEVGGVYTEPGRGCAWHLIPKPSRKPMSGKVNTVRRSREPGRAQAYCFLRSRQSSHSPSTRASSEIITQRPKEPEGKVKRAEHTMAESTLLNFRFHNSYEVSLFQPLGELRRKHKLYQGKKKTLSW